MHQIQQRLALAEHIYESTQTHPFSSAYGYTPLDLPSGPASYLQSQCKLDPCQLKLFAFSAQRMHPSLPLVTHPPTLTHIAQQHSTRHTPLCHMVRSYTRPVNAVTPLTHVLQFLCTVIGAVNVWTTTSALASETYHTPTQPWCQWNTPLTPSSHIVLCTGDTPINYHSHITSRR